MMNCPELGLNPPEDNNVRYVEGQIFFCSQCHQEIPEEQNMFGLCKRCEDSAQKAFIKLMQAFTGNERDFLNWRYDGQEF
jgi:predicted amidophosphoribosyltransferase